MVSSAVRVVRASPGAPRGLAARAGGQLRSSAAKGSPFPMVTLGKGSQMPWLGELLPAEALALTLPELQLLLLGPSWVPPSHHHHPGADVPAWPGPIPRELLHTQVWGCPWLPPAFCPDLDMMVYIKLGSSWKDLLAALQNKMEIICISPAIWQI